MNFNPKMQDKSIRRSKRSLMRQKKAEADLELQKKSKKVSKKICKLGMSRIKGGVFSH